MTARQSEIRAVISLIHTYRELSWNYLRRDEKTQATRCRNSAWWWIERARMWRAQASEATE